MRNILVSAYACEPLKGSEQGVGWNWVMQMAKNNKVHVITRANNREIIEKHLPPERAMNIVFHYYDCSRFILSLKNKEKGVYLYYLLWQLGIIPLVSKLINQYKIDYTIHLTMGSIWIPTFLPLFKVPFIWGPTGGGESIPNSFIKTMSVKGQALQMLRIMLKYTRFLNPLFIVAIHRASAIICRTDRTAALIPKGYKQKVHLMSDGAIESDIFAYQTMPKEGKDCIQLVTTSRLIHTKNVITIIRALNFLPPMYKYHLTIVGSGPENHRICQEIQSLNLQGKITINPPVERTEVFKIIERSDIYLFASLKEACNLSLLEAMAVGLPIICLNWSGMAISTDEESAIRLPVTNPEQMPKDMAQAIRKLIDHPELRHKMGVAARERIKNVFNWEAKSTFMETLFSELDAKKKPITSSIKHE